MSAYTIVNPFRRNQNIIIPKGTVIRSLNPKDSRRGGYRIAGVTTTIKIHTVFDGWVDTVNASRRGNGFVNLPSVSWAGSSGYWQDAQITEALCAANGIPMPPLPDISEFDRIVRLEVIPSYDPGYCDRWSAERVLARIEASATQPGYTAPAVFV